MPAPVAEEPRGILDPNAKKFRLSRYLPGTELQTFIEYYWIVAWDLRGQEPYLAENLAHPTVHLVIQHGQSNIYGVVTGKFSYLVKDKGRAFGVKFKPGAFYPFVRRPVSEYTNRTIALNEIFGTDAITLECEILALEDDRAMVETAERFLCERSPEYDQKITVINDIIQTISTDRAIIKVDNITERLGIEKRWLQRLFQTYVGVRPKWVIQCYRLHEAAEQLAQGTIEDWPALALNLGYFDQAHFIKDFKAIVGKTPAAYVRNCQKKGV